jgi:hypothetical protein
MSTNYALDWARKYALQNPDNPNPAWDDYRSLLNSLSVPVKNNLREVILLALDKGYSVAQLKKALLERHPLTEEQAESLSWTEIARADVGGNMESYRQSEVVVGKEWLLPSPNGCDVCLLNAQAGIIPLNDLFPSGDDAPPAHSKCRCDVSPVT